MNYEKIEYPDGIHKLNRKQRRALKSKRQYDNGDFLKDKNCAIAKNIKPIKEAAEYGKNDNT